MSMDLSRNDNPFLPTTTLLLGPVSSERDGKETISLNSCDRPKDSSSLTDPPPLSLPASYFERPIPHKPGDRPECQQLTKRPWVGGGARDEVKPMEHILLVRCRAIESVGIRLSLLNHDLDMKGGKLWSADKRRESQENIEGGPTHSGETGCKLGKGDREQMDYKE